MSREITRSYCTECEWAVDRDEVGRSMANESLIQHYMATGHAIDTEELVIESPEQR